MKKRVVFLFMILFVAFLPACDKKEDNISKEEVKSRIKEAETTESSKTTSSEKESESEYILPMSNQRKLLASDLSSLSVRQLQLARNEIYARHGRKFDTASIQNYFNGKSWYHGTIEPEDADIVMEPEKDKN